MKPAWMRGIAAILVLMLGGYAAWHSIPGARKIFDPTQVATIRQMSAAQFWLQPDVRVGDIQPLLTGWRAAAGSEVRFNVAPLNGRILRGKLRASTSAGASVKITTRRGTGDPDVLLTWHIPAGNGAESAVFYFLVDPETLPAGSGELCLSVAPESAGPVDWHEIDLSASERLPLLAVLAKRLIAYVGFAYPMVTDERLMLHAPSVFVLGMPAGRQEFQTSFGFNPALFNESGNSDGMAFRGYRLEGAKRQLLWDRLLNPANPTDRSLQSALISYDSPATSRLVVEIDAGPSGANNWDWGMWTGLQSDRPPTANAP